MYTRSQYDHELEAVEAADSCISAAVAGSDYMVRLIPYADDYVNIALSFWAKCPITKKRLEQPGPDVKEVAKVFLVLSRGTQVSGLDSKRMTATLERVRRKLKGRLFNTRMMLADAGKKSNCDAPKFHTQPCQCHPRNLANLAAQQEG